MTEPDFATHFTRHMAAMQQAARGVLRSDEEAQEVVQDAYVRLSGRLDSWRGTGSLRAWLCVVARRLAIDRLRGRPRIDAARLSREGTETNPLARSLAVEERERLRRAVETLPPAQKETVRLRFYAGLRLDEIAATRGTAVGTVKATLHQAIERLREELPEEDP